MRGAPATKQVSGKGQSSLYVLFLRLSAARRTWFPENIATFARGDVARGDEEMVRQAVEVSEQLRIDRLGLVERDGGPLGAPDDRSRKMECRNAGRAARKDEAGERRKARIHDVDVALQPLHL